MVKALTYIQIKIATQVGGSLAKNTAVEHTPTVKQMQNWSVNGKIINLSKESGSSLMEPITKETLLTTSLMEMESGTFSTEI